MNNLRNRVDAIREIELLFNQRGRGGTPVAGGWFSYSRGGILFSGITNVRKLMVGAREKI